MNIRDRATISNSTPNPVSESRRNLVTGVLAGAGSLIAAAPGSTSANAEAPPTADSAYLANADTMESRFVFYSDPVEHQQKSFRILRSALDDADVLFWYHFTMFAVVPGQRPEPVVRWEGIEFSRHQKVATNTYRVHGHNLSFPRDLKTGNWVNDVTNPVLGKQVDVPPMALTGDPGYVYTPKGTIPLDNPSAEPRIRLEQFLIEDDLIKIEQTRLPPASWPATFVETSSNWSNRRLFEETDLPSLPCGTAGGYVFPWPKWMQMGEREGHMFATWNGRKLEGVHQLPADYVAKASSSYPELLSVDKAPFGAELPPEITKRLAEIIG